MITIWTYKQGMYILCYSCHLEVTICAKQRTFQILRDSTLSRFNWNKMRKTAENHRKETKHEIKIFKISVYNKAINKKIPFIQLWHI